MTNALPHVGSEMVINFDIKNFFPSISRYRVKLMFMALGRDDEEAEFLSFLATCNDKLPQGAPTSPIIANIICIDLDNKLSALANNHNANYTRYADDLTFSGKQSILRMLPEISKTIMEEGFKLNPSKFRIQRKGNRQEVTGLTVNDKVSVHRSRKRKLRAAVHRKSNNNKPHWNNIDLSPEQLKGHIDFVTSIHPELIERYIYPYNSFNKYGFNRYGYDRNGYDRSGFDCYGFDRGGYNTSGFNAFGYGIDGFDCFGYNFDGYDKEGINKHGFNRLGYDKLGFDLFGFNQNGFDISGYNSYGYDKYGIDRNGFDIDGVYFEEYDDKYDDKYDDDCEGDTSNESDDDFDVSLDNYYCDDSFLDYKIKDYTDPVAFVDLPEEPEKDEKYLYAWQMRAMMGYSDDID